MRLKSIAVAKIFMQMKTNRFNHVVIKVGALWHLQKKDVRNSEFHSYSKSKEKLDLFFIKSFYSEDSNVFVKKDWFQWISYLGFGFIKMFWIHKNEFHFQTKKFKLFMLWWLLLKQIYLTRGKEKRITQCPNKNETLLCWNVSIIPIVSYY